MNIVLIDGVMVWDESKIPLTNNEIETFLNDNRVSGIKAKAGEIISNKYSIIWQLNHPRLDTKYDDDYAWIDNIRAISDKAEIDGTSLDDIDWGIL